MLCWGTFTLKKMRTYQKYTIFLSFSIIKIVCFQCFTWMYTYAPYICLVLGEVGKQHWALGPLELDGVTDVCELRRGCWEVNPSSARAVGAPNHWATVTPFFSSLLPLFFKWHGSYFFSMLGIQG